MPINVSTNSLLSFVEKAFDQDPHLAAQALETMEESQAIEVIKVLPPELTKEVFDHLNELYASVILPELPEPLSQDIVRGFEPEKVATLFLHIPPDKRRSLFRTLPPKSRRQIRDFLAYPENSAGRIMSTRLMAFPGTMKVSDAVSRVRRWRTEGRPISYMYVVDKDNRLIGIMNTWDMLQSDPKATLSTLMHRDVFSVNCFMDRELIANEVSSRHYFAVPVVDNQQRLLGVVRAEDLIEDVQEEASEDIQKMFGAGGDEKAFSPISFSLRQRLPWLHVNLVTAFMAAAVVGLFEDIIAKITVLAVFLPVVAGQGGNAGAQSLAVVMRGLVMRDIPRTRYKFLVLKEAWIGAINGVIIGLVTALIAWMWHGNPYLGLVIGLGMIANLIIAGFAGAAIPLTMKSIGLDPAQCSNIILTTISDGVGFFAFLGFAVIFQENLLAG